MSRHRWIDDLFRRKLEQRSFPADENELNEMRALLELRNAAMNEGARKGFNWWWLSTAIPLALMAWWTMSGEAGIDAEQMVERTSAMNEARTKGRATSPDDPDRTWADASAEAVQIIPREGSAPTAANGRRPGNEKARMEGSARSTSAIVARSNSSPTLEGSDTTEPWVVPGPEQQDAQAQPHTEAGEGFRRNGPMPFPSLIHTVSLRRDVERAFHLDLRPTRLQEVTPAQPLRGEAEILRIRANGELHFFGAPLHVRTRTDDGSDPGKGSGSLFGLEYRVRSRRLLLSTGVHYGTYMLRANDADVRLNYVELPLMAGTEVGHHRFGLLLQAGIGIDLLFNTGGRYPLPDQRLGAGFPDDAFSTLNFSWVLRPQVVYRVNDRVSMSAGPLWKAQLRNVAGDGPLQGAHASSTGLGIGLTWRLDRSTF
ncbi:MAG TPA: hypothetical protein VGE21_01490 [Flavobacteriales bacterium]